MKNCKSLQGLKDYFSSKEDTDIEVQENFEVIQRANPLSFLDSFRPEYERLC